MHVCVLFVGMWSFNTEFEGETYKKKDARYNGDMFSLICLVAELNCFFLSIR